MSKSILKLAKLRWHAARVYLVVRAGVDLARSANRSSSIDLKREGTTNQQLDEHNNAKIEIPPKQGMKAGHCEAEATVALRHEHTRTDDRWSIERIATLSHFQTNQ